MNERWCVFIAVRLERKLFTILKYILIFLPLFITIVAFLYPNILKISYVSGDTLPSQTITESAEEDIENYKIDGDSYVGGLLGDNIFDYLINYYVVIPGVISSVYTSTLAEYMGGYSSFINYFACYLDTIIIIELLFLCLYLFRYILHFGVYLIERKVFKYEKE